MPERLGFIGLGVMGKPMARNLLRAGYEIVVHNRSRDAVADLAREGAIPADSPRAVAAQASIVITMLPDAPDVRAVALGPDGLLEAMGAASLLIDMSTISPVVAREVGQALAERGARMLDAPVSGGERGAIEGSLSIMVGGAAEDVERARPILTVLGRTIVHVGDSGAGQTVKACNQVVVALTLEALSEALVLGAKAGVDPRKIVEVLSGGLAASRVLELRGDAMLAHDFQPGFRLRLHRKDLDIALAAGRDAGVPLPVTALVSQMLASLVATGHGDLDHAALLLHLEALAGYHGERLPEE